MSRSTMTLREKHPELYVSASTVDPGNRTRVVPMEVLCLGYMRTGTACEFFFFYHHHHHPNPL